MYAQRGNALFLILIAVVLFAALSYAVTRSGRGGGGISKEQAILDAAAMVSYAGAMTDAVTRLSLVNGCSDTQLNFASSRWVSAPDYVNATAPADGSCNIFDVNGAGFTWEKPPSSSPSVEYYVTGGITLHGVGQTASDVDPNSKDLLLTTRTTRDICLAINNKLGITNPGGNPPAWTVQNRGLWPELSPGFSIGFNGVYDDDNCLGCVAGAPEIAGQYTSCVRCPAGSNADCPTIDFYLFVHVLRAR